MDACTQTNQQARKLTLNYGIALLTLFSGMHAYRLTDRQKNKQVSEQTKNYFGCPFHLSNLRLPLPCPRLG
jgi:hypothetical protein